MLARLLPISKVSVGFTADGSAGAPGSGVVVECVNLPLHDFALRDVPYAHYTFHLPRETWADDAFFHFFVDHVVQRLEVGVVADLVVGDHLGGRDALRLVRGNQPMRQDGPMRPMLASPATVIPDGRRCAITVT